MRGGGGAVPASCFQKIDMTLSAISPSILEESLLWSPWLSNLGAIASWFLRIWPLLCESNLLSKKLAHLFNLGLSIRFLIQSYFLGDSLDYIVMDYFIPWDSQLGRPKWDTRERRPLKWNHLRLERHGSCRLALQWERWEGAPGVHPPPGRGQKNLCWHPFLEVSGPWKKPCVNRKSRGLEAAASRAIPGGGLPCTLPRTRSQTHWGHCPLQHKRCPVALPARACLPLLLIPAALGSQL